LRSDVKDLANVISNLLENKNMLEEMGKRAKEKVRTTYLSTANLKRYLDVINSVVNG